MYKQDLYKKTVDILFNAYFNDTLKHGDTCGCAVGNLVAAGLGLNVIFDHDKEKPVWSNGIEDAKWSDALLYGRIYLPDYKGEAKKQLDATGYTLRQLAIIEVAFENAPRFASMEDRMFNGLCAVLDVLAQIHQIDEATATTSKEPFANHYQQLKPCTAK